VWAVKIRAVRKISRLGQILAYPNDHNEGSDRGGRMMGWSDLHGDVQIGAEMTPRRQRFVTELSC
jgi:hypothetical protein